MIEPTTVARWQDWRDADGFAWEHRQALVTLRPDRPTGWRQDNTIVRAALPWLIERGYVVATGEDEFDMTDTGRAKCAVILAEREALEEQKAMGIEIVRYDPRNPPDALRIPPMPTVKP